MNTTWGALVAIALAASPLPAYPIRLATAVDPLPTEQSPAAQPSLEYDGSYGTTDCGCAAEPQCCSDACNDCAWCGPGPGAFATFELTFFRYHRADGVRIGDAVPAEDVEFDFEMSPRFTAGYVCESGLGLRGRWWSYDHTAGAEEGNGSDLSVDTCTFDLEVFDTYAFGSDWCLEVSGGLRFNQFEETMLDPAEGDLRTNDFDGYGGVVGLELRRRVSCYSSLFARTRGALLMDDKEVLNVDNGGGVDPLLRDTTQGMVELALGICYNRPVGCGVTFVAHANGEWQNWYNYSSSFGSGEDQFAGPSDVGFGGIALGVGLSR